MILIKNNLLLVVCRLESWKGQQCFGMTFSLMMYHMLKLHSTLAQWKPNYFLSSLSFGISPHFMAILYLCMSWCFFIPCVFLTLRGICLGWKKKTISFETWNCEPIDVANHFWRWVQRRWIWCSQTNLLEGHFCPPFHITF